MNRKKLNLLLFLFVFGFAVLASQVFGADTWYVSKDGNDDNNGTSWDDAKLTIGAAITDAASGDTIYVGAGSYDEHVDFVGKSLWLEGMGMYTTEIAPGPGLGAALQVSDNSVVKNLSAIRSGDSGIAASSTNNVIIDSCYAFSNTDSIMATGSTNIWIKNCVAEGTYDGIVLTGSTDALVENCNTIVSGNSFLCGEVVGLQIKNSYAASPKIPGYFRDTTGLVVDDSTFVSSQTANGPYHAVSAPAGGVFNNCSFVSTRTAAGAFELGAISCIAGSNVFNNCFISVTAGSDVTGVVYGVQTAGSSVSVQLNNCAISTIGSGATPLNDLRNTAGALTVHNSSYDKDKTSGVITDTTDPNLIAYYPCDDNSASSIVLVGVIDSSSGSCGDFIGTDTNTNAHSVTGKVGSALSFNGTTDYIDTDTSFQSIFQDSFSVNFWCQPDDGQPASVQLPIGAYDSSNGKFGIQINTDGSVFITYLSSELTTETFNGVFYDGVQPWTMMTLVISKMSETTINISFYVNGSLIETRGPSNNTMGSYATSENLYLGALSSSGGGASEYFSGSLDNIMIFNKALTGEEITDLYNEGGGIEDSTPPTCSISSISVSTNYGYVSGSTIYYNPAFSGSFTVNVSASDEESGVWKVNFPDTVSAGGDDTDPPYSFDYNWDTSDTFSQSADVTCYDNMNNTQTASFTVTRRSSGDKSSPNCFIATACYGTPMAEEVKVLSQFRDEYLLTNPIGEGFVRTYNKVSPRVALFITEHPVLKRVVRGALNPLIRIFPKAVE